MCDASGGVRGRGKCALPAAARPLPLGARAVRVGGPAPEPPLVVEMVRPVSARARRPPQSKKKSTFIFPQVFAEDVDAFVAAHDVWAVHSGPRIVIVSEGSGRILGWFVGSALAGVRARAVGRSGAQSTRVLRDG